LGNATHFCYLGGHFRRGQKSTHARFSTLAQLDFNRSNGSRRDRFEERVGTKISVVIATSKIPSTELKDQFSPMKVVVSYSTFTSVVKTTIDRCATIECLNRRS
jgi:hypothetical protein